MYDRLRRQARCWAQDCARPNSWERRWKRLFMLPQALLPVMFNEWINGRAAAGSAESPANRMKRSVLQIRSWSYGDGSKFRRGRLSAPPRRTVSALRSRSCLPYTRHRLSPQDRAAAAPERASSPDAESSRPGQLGLLRDRGTGRHRHSGRTVLIVSDGHLPCRNRISRNAAAQLDELDIITRQYCWIQIT